MTTTTAALSPSDAYRAGAYLRTPEARARAAAALHAVLKERGHGSVVQLKRAIEVSATTIGNWRPGGEFPPNPDQVRQIATAYAADLDRAVTPVADLELSEEQEQRVDELFNLFYSDNHRDAATWLIEHKPAHFGWNAADHSTMVA